MPASIYIKDEPVCRLHLSDATTSPPLINWYIHSNCHSPCFIMTVRKRTMTLEQGLMRTWRFPRFSALLMLFRASARTFMRTMMPANTSIRISIWNDTMVERSKKNLACVRFKVYISRFVTRVETRINGLQRGNPACWHIVSQNQFKIVSLY